MKKYIFFIIFSLIVIIFSSCSLSKIYKKLGISDDNIVEEMVESEIKTVTGLDIDLTPESKEEI